MNGEKKKLVLKKYWTVYNATMLAEVNNTLFLRFYKLTNTIHNGNTEEESLVHTLYFSFLCLCEAILL